MQIYENLMPATWLEDANYVFDGTECKWVFAKETIYGEIEKTKDPVIRGAQTKDSPQLVHQIVQHQVLSEHYYLAYAFVLYLEQAMGVKIKRLFRMKMNMMLKDPEFPVGFYNPPHTDHANPELVQPKVKTAVFYVKDSDGDTVFFNNFIQTTQDGKDLLIPEEKDLQIAKTVTPKANSCVVFEGNRLHSSCPPKNNKNRIVLNLLFEIE